MRDSSAELGRPPAQRRSADDPERVDAQPADFVAQPIRSAVAEHDAYAEPVQYELVDDAGRRLHQHGSVVDGPSGPGGPGTRCRHRALAFTVDVGTDDRPALHSAGWELGTPERPSYWR